MKFIVENCYGEIVQTFFEKQRAVAWLKSNAKIEGQTPYVIYECRAVYTEI